MQLKNVHGPQPKPRVIAPDLIIQTFCAIILYISTYYLISIWVFSLEFFTVIKES